MNITGTEGNAIRQIVPADFSHLSGADEVIVECLYDVMKASGLRGSTKYAAQNPLIMNHSLNGWEMNDLVIIGGESLLEGLSNTPKLGLRFGNQGDAVTVALVGTWALWRGKLWTVRSEKVTVNVQGLNDLILASETDQAIWNTLLSYYLHLVLEEEIVAPSPVYGADETETVSPHKRRVLKLAVERNPVTAGRTVLDIGCLAHILEPSGEYPLRLGRASYGELSHFQWFLGPLD